MKKILLTGGGGFFASRFNEYYKSKYDILLLKRNDLDITEEARVIECFKSFKPDFVVHTAAIADTGRCEREENASFKINVLGTANVAKASSLTKAKLINLSSEQIFNGNEESGPYHEGHIPVPNTVYGRQKLQAEGEILNTLEEAWILRLTWLFGFPERYGKINANIIWNVLGAAIKGDKIKLPVNEYRGMTYIYDLLKNFEKMFEIPFGIYHTGSENNLNTYDSAVIAVKEMGLENRLEAILSRDEEKFKYKSRDLRISNEKLKANGIEFMTTEEGLIKCVNDFGYILNK